MVSQEVVASVRRHLALARRSATASDIAEALRSIGQIVSDDTVLAIQDGIARDALGVGVLETILATPGLTDLVVNGPDQIFIDCGDGLRQAEVRFPDEDAVRQLAVRLAASVGRRLDDGSPFVDARLPSGVRFHAVLGGIAHPGTCLSLRVPVHTALSLDQWQTAGSVDPTAGEILRRVISTRTAFLICGGTGSGKTTLLATLLSLVPDSQRLVIVEDSRELEPQHAHTVHLESRPVNGEGVGLITMTDLVRQALRMRPDRLVVGEVRGAELRDLLQALNTGHEGGCGTIHANSIEDLPARLEALAGLGGLTVEATQSQVAAAIKVVIHVCRRGPLRHVAQIGVIQRSPDGRLGTLVAWEGIGGTGHAGPGMDALTRMLS
ncbi:MAG: TadA family conjugal transfer-associated ATPase [Propionibacteriaceae bacterium]|jgi:pilus assembly protein CpaF|nr:TadA family conjugal transfer-associated ATPase [Propionibacteriaceae bacterium]